MKPQILRHLRDRRGPTLLAHVQRKPTRVVGILRQPIELLLLHATARATRDATQLERQEHTQRAARQIAHMAPSPIIPRPTNRATYAADRFF